MNVLMLMLQNMLKEDRYALYVLMLMLLNMLKEDRYTLYVLTLILLNMLKGKWVCLVRVDVDAAVRAEKREKRKKRVYILCASLMLILQHVLNETFPLQEYCLRFVVKDCNYSQIVMSREFETLEQPLMVEIIRRKQMPQQRLVDPQSDDMRGRPARLVAFAELFSSV